MIKFIIYSGFFMGGLMIFIGFLILFRDQVSFHEQYDSYIGIVILAYGVFRIWKSWRMFKNQQREQKEIQQQQNGTQQS